MKLSSADTESPICRYVFAYDPPNWNEYIQRERANRYAAASVKRHEKALAEEMPKYKGTYPAMLVVRPHFRDMRKDLDNTRYKGLLDSLVSHGCIENDNLRHVRPILIDPVFDGSECIELIFFPQPENLRDILPDM